MTEKYIAARRSKSSAELTYSRDRQNNNFVLVPWDKNELGHIHYLSHFLMEMGRLGLSLEKLSSSNREVVSNLLDWYADRPGDGYAVLVDWIHLDYQAMCKRVYDSPDAKPRIEISAEINDKGDLSVRWYPRGFRESYFDSNKELRSPFEHISSRHYPRPTDFQWFEGEEPAGPERRPTNELMFIGRVGALDPNPENECRQDAEYDIEAAEAILICAVRSAFDSLVRYLSISFEVTLMNDFAFDVCKGQNAGAATRAQANMNNLFRVVGWKLVDHEVPSLRPSAQIVQINRS